MKKYILPFYLFAVLLLASCVSTKNITYFQNKDQIDLAASKYLYDAKIMPKDILQIQPYLSESENVVVHVRMMNYKYAILGGVRSPGLYTTQNEKVSILEAIAQAGDLTTFIIAISK